MLVVTDIEKNAIKPISDWEPKAITFLAELKKFAWQRLDPLKGEIEKEESVSKAYTLITLMKKPYKIEHIGYTKPLQMKMADCFCEKDFDYIQTKIAQILGLM